MSKMLVDVREYDALKEVYHNFLAAIYSEHKTQAIRSLERAAVIARAREMDEQLSLLSA